MWQLFGSEIGRFSILAIGALIVFGMFWLYYDAWTERRAARAVPLLIGLLLLALSFLAQGMSFETSVLVSAWSDRVTAIARHGYLYMRASAYILILVGLIMTPLTERPKL